MFNNLIQKKFDLLAWGDSYVAPKPVLNPTVGYALHCVLVELLQIAKGKCPASAFPVAIKKFRSYFIKAEETIETGLLKDLGHLPQLSYERECGVRIACFLNCLIPVISQKDMDTYLTVPIREWLKDPKENERIRGHLNLMKNFNSDLTDSRIRQTFPSFRI